MGFVGCSPGAGRLPGSLARTWARTGARAVPGTPSPTPRRTRAWGLGPGASTVAGSLAQAWPGDDGQALPGFRVTCVRLGRARFRVTPPARPPTAREPPGLRGPQQRRRGRRAPARRTKRPPSPRPRPKQASAAVSWFFPAPRQRLLSETRSVRRSAPSRVRRPSGAPGSVRRGARRGPAGGSRVTWPKERQTARWRPPLRAGAVFRGAATGGVEGGLAPTAAQGPRRRGPGLASGERRPGWGGGQAPAWLAGNPAEGWPWAGFRVTRPRACVGGWLSGEAAVETGRGPVRGTLRP